MRLLRVRLAVLAIGLGLPATAEAQFRYNSDGNVVTITGYTGAAGSVTIPSSVGKRPVISIGNSAFSSSSLTSVTIPASVTNIAAGAFHVCPSLNSITVAAGNPAYGSVDGVLFAYESVDGIIYDKSQLTLVQYPGGKAGPYTISNNVTRIGDSSFYWCPSLTGVAIPNTVTTIGDFAFGYCTSLTNVTIPDSVTNIGDHAFLFCSSLSGLTLGRNLSSIGSGAFYSCPALTSLTIPSSVTSIQDSAFSTCLNMKGVYFQGNAPSADSSAFDYDDQTTVYYLPGTTGWSKTFSGRPTVLWNPQVQPGSSGVRTNQFGSNITGSSNLVVVIQATTSLANPTWLPLHTNTLNGNPLYFTDPSWTNYRSRFYRVTWP